MIVVRRKPLEEILSFLAPYRKVLLLGCGSCSAVCLAGGEKETEEVACLLPVMAREKQMDLEVRAATCQRVCDWEFVEPALAGDDKPDAIVSFACGAGVNLVADHLGEKIRVFPGDRHAVHRRHDGARRMEGDVRRLRRLRPGQHVRRVPGGPVQQGPPQRALRRVEERKVRDQS